MTWSTVVGIAAALFAAFVWALNFIVPFVIGRYSVFDFSLLRFVVSGLICLVYVGFHRTAAGQLRWPTVTETSGMLVLIAGVMTAIHVFNGERSRGKARAAACTD